MPGNTLAIDCTARPVGNKSTVSVLTCCDTCALWTSTMGEAPDTVMVSSTAPTRSSALTCAVKFVVSSMPSRLNAANPGSVNVIVYTPGTRLVILYSPEESVVAARTFSISAGLEASTVTPGNTAPLVSFTEPARPLPRWAQASVANVGSSRMTPTTAARITCPFLVIDSLPDGPNLPRPRRPIRGTRSPRIPVPTHTRPCNRANCRERQNPTATTHLSQVVSDACGL